jgi:hypothetical protein
VMDVLADEDLAKERRACSGWPRSGCLSPVLTPAATKVRSLHGRDLVKTASAPQTAVSAGTSRLRMATMEGEWLETKR